MGRVPGWLTRHSVLLACLATALVHAFWVTRFLAYDEGGYAVISRYWTEPGPYLYGPFWVDRPPVLIGLFSVGVHLGPYGVRLLALVVSVALVAAVAAAAHAVGGRTAAAWAAWVGFATACSIELDTKPLNGELVAALFVSVSVACTLRAVQPLRSARARLGWAGAGGVAAMLAPLAKQNFVDGFAFAGTFLLLALVTTANRRRLGRVLPVVGALAGGAVVVLVATVVWAQAHHGLSALVYAMYGFRTDATHVMLDRPLTQQAGRASGLVRVGLETGLFVMALLLLALHGRRLRRLDPLPWALVAAGLVALVGLVGGVNFYTHYLVALIPVVAITAGIAARRHLFGWQAVRVLTVLMVVVSLFFSTRSTVRAFSTPRVSHTLGQWIADSAHGSDTVVAPYTRVAVIANTGLRPGYTYLWVLPVVTLDPDLSLFVRGLDAARVGTPHHPGQVTAPTWFVQWDDLQMMGLDADREVERALREHYHRVGVVCGHTIWLHDGVRRTLAARPAPAECGGRGS